MGGGGGPRSTTVRQEQGPPPAFQPFFVDLFERAKQASQAVPSQPFAGAFRAGIDPTQAEALNAREAFARGLDPNLGAGITNLANRTISGEFLRPESNPFLEAQAQAITRPIEEDFFRRALPSLKSSAVAQGAFGGSREQIAGAQLASETSRNILDARSRLFGENFARERGFQAQAPQLLEAGVRFGQLPSALLGEVGASRRGFAQERVEEELARFNESLQAPFRPLFPFASLLAQTDVGTAGSTVRPQFGPSDAARGITGALGGGATGAAIGSAGGFSDQNQLISTILAALAGGGSAFV